MATVTQICNQRNNELIISCDFSPPRNNSTNFVEQLTKLDTDFICVSYSPGKSARVSSNITAYLINKETGKDVIFNIATRDMNKLALQSSLLGSRTLGLQNVVVLKGDQFYKNESHIFKEVNDITPTELINSIQSMNQGHDYKNLTLGKPINFCVGATFDLNKGIKSEAELVLKKVLAGADFFLAQPVYDIQVIEDFKEIYKLSTNNELEKPIFYGLQILSNKSSVTFGNVPTSISRDLENGRDGTAIAIEWLHKLAKHGISNFYLIPPILNNGVRNYEAAQKVIESVR